MKKFAICYDFDKTLTPTDMQAQGFVQTVGMDAQEFWKIVDDFSISENVELNHTYMFMMLRYAKQKGVTITRSFLNDLGANIKFFNGVESWFERINAIGKSMGVEVHHFVISSGNREIIEGTSIAKYFEKIYASEYLYEDGIAVWPAHVVSYTNKTQFLFRISKGIFLETDDSVNDYMPFENFNIPFSNFLYIGDSDTDIPCMALLHQYGGYAIGVYDPDVSGRGKAERLLREKRVESITAADYKEGGTMETLVKKILSKIN